MHKRTIINIPVLYSKMIKSRFGFSSNEEYLAKTVDMSEGGAGLITNEYLSLGAEIKLKIKRADDILGLNKGEDKYICFEGKVSHISPMENRQFRAGISFGPITQENCFKFFDIICTPQSLLDLQVS